MKCREIVILAVAALFWALPLPKAYAQRGMGDSTGVVRQGLVPKLVKLSGELAAIETHACPKTTGYGVVGSHLKVKTGKGEELIIDLGWARAVEPIVKKLTVGQKLAVVAFRTEKMPKGQYVAKSLSVDGKTVQLRDNTLRPFWAGGRPGWYGPQGRAGYGQGPGRGRGWGRGRGRGRGAGRGPGYGWR